ncbi:MAG: hypothetical protein O2871_02245 [bacterium]|nr:hypothetical protein [bacterium]
MIPLIVIMGFYEKIIEFLNSKNVNYQLFEHEPVFTSKQASEVRGGGVIEQGAKALVFDIGRPVMLVLRGNDKVDGKLAKSILQAKQVPLATPENVKKYTGVEIGAVAPFGFLLGIETFVDEKLFNNEHILFNPGKHNKTIKMLALDYKKIGEIKLQNFSKND